MTNSIKGGPKTTNGKSVSSKNAIKIGIYTNTLMEGESQEEIDELLEHLRDNHPSDNAQVEMMHRCYAQSLLKSRRLQEAEAALIEAHMHMQSSRKEFCRQVNISPLLEDGVPDWFFSEEAAPKQLAIQRGMSMFEALDLKRHHTLELSLSARTQYPNLWKEVMGPHAINPKQSLGERLQVLYVTGNPHSNLQAFADDYRDRYKYELMWTRNSQRYLSVINALKAKAMLEISSRPDWLKIENLQHKRRMELTHTLLAIDKHESMKNAIEIVATVPSDAQQVSAHSATHSLTLDIGQQGEGKNSRGGDQAKTS